MLLISSVTSVYGSRVRVSILLLFLLDHRHRPHHHQSFRGGDDFEPITLRSSHAEAIGAWLWVHGSSS